MPELLTIRVNDVPLRVARGTTVAAAMLLAEEPTRFSVRGEPRSAVCGMGICFECRAMVNGVPHRRTCQILCEPEMTVDTNP